MQQHFLSSQKLFIPIVLRSTILNISISPSISSTLVPKWRRVSQFHANERTNERRNGRTNGPTNCHYRLSILRIIPKADSGWQGIRASSLERRQGRLPARDRADKNQPARWANAEEKGGWGWKRNRGCEYYESSIPCWLVGMKASRAVTFRFGMGTQRARSGQNNVKSALPTPRRNFRLPAQLVRPSALFSLSFSLSLSQSFLLLLARARQHRYPTTSLKYLSLPGGLTRVKWYRDTWTRDYWFFDRSRWRIRRSRLKYRLQWNARSAVGYIVFGTGEKPAPSVARELPRIEGVILLFEIVRGLGVCGNCCWS